jgi:signal peptidase
MTAGRRARSWIASATLNLAALGGLICIVLVGLALVFNLTLIMFKTGSMSPGIPAGSLALVQEVPASAVRPGDIVTVDRAGTLPVTHRVTSVSPGPSMAERVLTLRGDANSVDDPAPYTVDTVRTVLFAAPGLASFVVWLGNPVVMAILTLCVSALVTWAFWPRGNDPERRRPAAHAARGPTRGAASPLAIAIMLCAVGAVVADPPPAAAAPTEQIRSGSHITLTTIGDEQAMAAMAPGVSTAWVVGVQAEAPDPGRILVGLAGAGSSALGITATISSCAERWVGERCPGGATTLRERSRLHLDGREQPLLAMSSAEQRWLRFELRIPDAAAAESGTHDGSVQLTVRASGVGDDVSTSPGVTGPLPGTGFSPGNTLFSAFGAIILGLLAAGIARVLARRPRPGLR